MRNEFGITGVLLGVLVIGGMVVSGYTLHTDASAPAVFFNVQSQGQTKQPVQEFQGTIEKSGAKYILEDKASGAKYQLDKQDEAREFAGKDVKITGTLDPSSNTIEVSEIKAESAGQ